MDKIKNIFSSGSKDDDAKASDHTNPLSTDARGTFASDVTHQAKHTPGSSHPASSDDPSKVSQHMPGAFSETPRDERSAASGGLGASNLTSKAGDTRGSTLGSGPGVGAGVDSGAHGVPPMSASSKHTTASSNTAGNAHGSTLGSGPGVGAGMDSGAHGVPSAHTTSKHTPGSSSTAYSTSNPPHSSTAAPASAAAAAGTHPAHTSSATGNTGGTGYATTNPPHATTAAPASAAAATGTHPAHTSSATGNTGGTGYATTNPPHATTAAPASAAAAAGVMPTSGHSDTASNASIKSGVIGNPSGSPNDHHSSSGLPSTAGGAASAVPAGRTIHSTRETVHAPESTHSVRTTTTTARAADGSPLHSQTHRQREALGAVPSAAATSGNASSMGGSTGTATIPASAAAGSGAGSAATRQDPSFSNRTLGNSPTSTGQYGSLDPVTSSTSPYATNVGHDPSADLAAHRGDGHRVHGPHQDTHTIHPRETVGGANVSGTTNLPDRSRTINEPGTHASVGQTSNYSTFPLGGHVGEGPHMTATANRLDPHVPDTGAMHAAGTHQHGDNTATTGTGHHGHHGHHGAGAAAVGTGAGAGALGVGQHAKHGDNKHTLGTDGTKGTDQHTKHLGHEHSSVAAGTAAGTGAGVGALGAEQHLKHQGHEHSLGTAGTTGIGQDSIKHHGHGHTAGSTAAGQKSASSNEPYGHAYKTLGDGAPSGISTADAAHPDHTSAKASGSHHLGRDAAAVGGTGAVGAVGAHELKQHHQHHTTGAPGQALTTDDPTARDIAAHGGASGMSGSGMTSGYNAHQHPSETVAQKTLTGDQTHRTGGGVLPTGSHTHENKHHVGGNDAAALGAGSGATGMQTGHTQAGHTQTGHNQPMTAVDTGPASKTIGPHPSNVANVLDPRVKPDFALQGSHKAQIDPRVDSQSGGSGAATGAGTTGGNVAGHNVEGDNMDAGKHGDGGQRHGISSLLHRDNPSKLHKEPPK